MTPGTVKDKSVFGATRTPAETHPRPTAAPRSGRTKLTLEGVALVGVGTVMRTKSEQNTTTKGMRRNRVESAGMVPEERSTLAKWSSNWKKFANEKVFTNASSELAA